MARRKERRGTAANAASLNEVLLDGEIFYEKDTNRVKLGDGTTPYNSRPYFGGSPSAGDEVAVSTNQNNLTIGPEELIPLNNSSGVSRTVTGIVAGVDGTIKRLVNRGTSTIVLSGEDTGSTAANRFTSSASLAPGEQLTLVYSGSRWGVFI